MLCYVSVYTVILQTGKYCISYIIMWHWSLLCSLEGVYAALYCRVWCEGLWCWPHGQQMADDQYSERAGVLVSGAEPRRLEQLDCKARCSWTFCSLAGQTVNLRDSLVDCMLSSTNNHFSLSFHLELFYNCSVRPTLSRDNICWPFVAWLLHKKYIPIKKYNIIYTILFSGTSQYLWNRWRYTLEIW